MDAGMGSAAFLDEAIEGGQKMIGPASAARENLLAELD